MMPKPDAGQHRRLWELDCTAVTTVVAHGLPAAERRAIARANLCACCIHLAEDDALVLQRMHRACHGENKFSQGIEDKLNARFARHVQHVRETSIVELTRQLATRPLVAHQAIGIVWALVTDPDAQKNELGQRMIHALIIRGVETTAQADRGYRETCTGLTNALGHGVRQN